MQTLPQFQKTTQDVPARELPDVEGRYIYLIRATRPADLGGGNIKPLVRRTMIAADITHTALVELGFQNVRIRPVRKLENAPDLPSEF